MHPHGQTPLLSFDQWYQSRCLLVWEKEKSTVWQFPPGFFFTTLGRCYMGIDPKPMKSYWKSTLPMKRYWKSTLFTRTAIDNSSFLGGKGASLRSVPRGDNRWGLILPARCGARSEPSVGSLRWSKRAMLRKRWVDNDISTGSRKWWTKHSSDISDKTY